MLKIKKDKRERIIDIIEFVKAYSGFGFFTWWGFWCISNNYKIFTNISGFITNIGGIL